jgi:hypothetical protein
MGSMLVAWTTRSTNLYFSSHARGGASTEYAVPCNQETSQGFAFGSLFLVPANQGALLAEFTDIDPQKARPHLSQTHNFRPNGLLK